MNALAPTSSAPEIHRGSLGGRMTIGEVHHDFTVYRSAPDNLAEDVAEVVTPDDNTLGVVVLRSNLLGDQASVSGVALLESTEDPLVDTIEINVVDRYAQRSSILANMILEAEMGAEPGNKVVLEGENGLVCKAATRAGYIACLQEDERTILLQKAITATKNPVSMPPISHTPPGFPYIPPAEPKKLLTK